MKKEDKLRELFVEINKKPDGLDARIMHEVYKQAKINKPITETKPKPWTWTYILLGILFIFGILYVLFTIGFKQNALAWLIGLAALLPLGIEKIILSKGKSKTNYSH